MVFFLNELLLPHLSSRSPNDAVIAMDNFKFHHSREVQEAIARNKNRLLYLPRYSPQLNPIEQVFSSIKQCLRALKPHPKTTNELKERLTTVISDYQQQDLQNYFS